MGSAPPEEVRKCGEHRAGYRDHVLYAMAFGTGLREPELIALSVGYVFRDDRPRGATPAIFGS